MSRVFSKRSGFGAGMSTDIAMGTEMSTKAYNLTMTGVVLYGLVINAILCALVSPLELLMHVSLVQLLVGYVVCVIGGILINRFCKSAVLKFIGYNLVVVPIGIVVSISVFAVGGISSPVVMGAIYYTALITAIMVIASYLFPAFFERIGRMLLFSLITLLVVGIIGLFVPALRAGGLYSYVGAGIFSLYIGFDVYRAQRFPKTMANAITAALDIYLDIVNIFLYILDILSDR